MLYMHPLCRQDAIVCIFMCNVSRSDIRMYRDTTWQLPHFLHQFAQILEGFRQKIMVQNAFQSFENSCKFSLQNIVMQFDDNKKPLKTSLWHSNTCYITSQYSHTTQVLIKQNHLFLCFAHFQVLKSLLMKLQMVSSFELSSTFLAMMFDI